MSLIGIYRPGGGPLHRLRPGAKLSGLIVFAVAVVSATGVTTTLIALGAAVALTVIAGLRPRELARVLRVFAIVAVPLGAFQTWQNGADRAVDVVGGLFALILAATAVTATTATDDMIDTIVWTLRPFRRLGVDPARVGLAFSLVLRTLPVTLEIAAETRAAARARGLDRSPRAYATPLVLRVVAHARHTGEALTARGLGDD